MSLRWCLVLTVVIVANAAGADEVDDRWGEVTARIEQLEKDYVELMEAPTATGLAVARELASELVRLAAALGAEGDDVHQEMLLLRGDIARAAEPFGMRDRFAWLQRRLEQSGHVRQSPDVRPSSKRGKAVYLRACAACHGADGSAATEIARQMSPPPVSFLDSDVVNPLSPFRVYNVVTWGEAGSAMPAFATLSERERWAVAFYVFSLRQPVCNTATPKIGATELARSTDNELTAKYREPGLACLRRPVTVR